MLVANHAPAIGYDQVTHIARATFVDAIGLRESLFETGFHDG